MIICKGCKNYNNSMLFLVNSFTKFINQFNKQSLSKCYMLGSILNSEYTNKNSLKSVCWG